MAKKKTASAPPARGGGFLRNSAPLWASIIIVLMIVVSLSSMVLVFFGMVPTIVAFVIDRSKQKSATFCVGGMNFCGVFYNLLELWSGFNTWNQAVSILTDVFAQAIMFSAAAFGWMLYISVPPVVIAFLTVMLQHKVAQLRAAQKEIIDEWGEDVAASPNMKELKGEDGLENGAPMLAG